MSAVEVLSFRVRIARTSADLQAACQVRAQGYGRRVPELEDALARPDPVDVAPGACVLLAVDKRSGEPIGTLRLQPNFGAPLAIESSVDLPAWFAGARGEFTRFAILPGADPLARHALVKAAFLYARAAQVRHLVVGARLRGLIRLYEGIGFSPLFNGEWMPLAHAGGIPHMVLHNDLADIEMRWRATSHHMLPFMVETFHPDIDLLTARPALAAFDTEPHLLPMAA